MTTDVHFRYLRLILKPRSLLLMMLVTLNAHAINFTEHKTSVPGVSLWGLDADGNYANELYLNEEDVFASLCNGKQKIYIYELNSAGYDCISRNHGKEDFEKFNTYTIELPELKPAVFGIGNVYTVSTKKIEQKQWKVSSLTSNEIKSVRSLIVSSFHKKSNNENYKYHLIVGERLELAKKISLTGFDILIVPTQRVEGLDGNGSTIMSTILVDNDGKYRVTGHIEGCLNRIGADIDGDGIPGVVVDDRCEPAESEHYRYFKIFPKTQLLIEYSIG
jgi:hypothetical protein